ncbi:UNVERIFIED_CONTAM: hypothetical protein HDU68_006144, partial [Siphonaria sp. JEL0065]
MQLILSLLILASAAAALKLDQIIAASKDLGLDGSSKPIGKSSTSSKPTQHLTYYKGPVIKNVEIRPLYFGQVAFKDDLDAFYTHISQSTWMDIMSQYGVGRGSLSVPGRYIRADATRITNTDIKALLYAMVKNGDLKPNENTYYPVHFSHGITIIDD